MELGLYANRRNKKEYLLPGNEVWIKATHGFVAEVVWDAIIGSLGDVVHIQSHPQQSQDGTQTTTHN